MSDEAQVLTFRGERMTRREVLIARDAYTSGAMTWCNLGPVTVRMARGGAESRYPLPTVTRTRVVDDADHLSYKVEVREDGRLVLWYRIPGIGGWQQGAPSCVDTERAAIIADLFANPTEEVEA